MTDEQFKDLYRLTANWTRSVGTFVAVGRALLSASKPAAPSADTQDERGAFQFGEFEEAEWNVALENMDTRTPDGVKKFAIWAIENRAAAPQAKDKP